MGEYPLLTYFKNRLTAGIFFVTVECGRTAAGEALEIRYERKKRDGTEEQDTEDGCVQPVYGIDCRWSVY